MAQPTSMDASIVIPTRDRRESLARCVGALAGQQTSRSHEVIVVDDGSEPPLQPRDLPPVAHLRIVRREGSGPARARNAGIHAATAPVVLFTDDDTEPFPDWIEAA